MSDANNLDTIPCNECQAGQMHRKFLAYFTWLGNDLVTVPDFPSWVCDVCGRREYDVHALNRLTLLLAENAGKPNHRSARTLHKAPQARPARPSRNRTE